MNRKQFAFLFALFLMIVALAPLSGQQTGSYDPWLDYNDDGIIDVYDLQALAKLYGTSGTPLSMRAALEYDSGWVNIGGKQGQYFNITHNMNITNWNDQNIIVDITGRTTLDGGLLRHLGLADMAWNRTYGGTSEDVANSMVQSSDGGYALAGSAVAGSSDFWLVKTDGAGNMLWSKTYGGATDDIAYYMVQSGDGGYALAGSTLSYGAGGSDFWLVKTDSSGNMLWNKTYGGASRDGAYYMVQTGDGGYALAGATRSFGVGSFDFWLVKTDSSGSMLWNKTYGGTSWDVAYSIVQSSDGGYVLAGSTLSYGAGGYDFWLVKTDGAGSMLWNQTYGGATDDIAYSMVQTGDGGYALAGAISSGGGDFWLVKTDSSGNMLWNKTYGGISEDVAYSIVQSSDGGYVLAGSTLSYGAGGYDFWLVKTDGAGNMLWNRTYGGAYRDEAYSMVQTGDGGYALAGATRSFGAGSWDFRLVKTDSSGSMLWSQTYGGTSWDVAYSIVQSSDGGYALAGSTLSYGAGLKDFLLVKTDSSGNMLWNKTYGGATDDIAYSMVQTGDGGYALAGYTYGAGGSDFWLVKTDSSGSMLWNKTYEGTTSSSSDVARSVVQTSDGGYALAGYTYGAGGSDFWLVKTDLAGNALWNKTYGGTGLDIAYSMVQTGDGGYALAGYTSDFAGGCDFLLVKTDLAGNALWNKTYGGAYNDVAHSIVQSSDGGYVLAGSTLSYGVGREDFWLVKTDGAGNMLWSQTYGGTSWDVAYSMVQSGDGYALAGATESFGAGTPAYSNFWLIETEDESGLTWTDSTADTITLYRGVTDAYWNYVRIRIWVVKENP